MQRRHRGLNPGLLLLLSQLYQVGFHNIPPVTLATLAVNIFFFLQPLKPLDKACISVNYCLYQKDWHRLYLSAFHHADDWHLYFNMVSLLWKGIKLEKRLGTVWFGYIIALFSLLVGAVYLFLEAILAELLGDPLYEHHCAVGFSGVLFALKILNNYYHPGGSTNIMGLNVSNKYSCWLELLAIHLLNPQSSFAGHLAGILVGLMYTMGPLKTFMTACTGQREKLKIVLKSLVDEGGPLAVPMIVGMASRGGHVFPTGFSEQRNNYRTENFRYSDNPSYPPNNYDYDMYTGGLTEEEQFERAVSNSLRERGSNTRHYTSERRPYGFWLSPEELSAEELRRQRLYRFERWQ